MSNFYINITLDLFHKTIVEVEHKIKKLLIIMKK